MRETEEQEQRDWCRCPDPLPAKTERFGRDWTCSACGGKRRYMERISVQNGGIVSRCGECRWTARRRQLPETSVPLTTCRAVTCTTQLAGELRQWETYFLCDRCADAEIANNPNADIVDGREVVAA